jgi:hypothetical protein
VEEGSNTTIAVRVVGGDKREPGVCGYNWATLFLGDINTGTWPSWRSLESETVDGGTAGVGPENDCAGKAQQQL